MKVHELENSDFEKAQRRSEKAQNTPAPAPAPPGTAEGMLRLQQTHGNRFVQRMVEGGGESEIEPETQQAIESARGAGRPLDAAVRGQMEQAFGSDFGGVRIHTGASSDVLNRKLSARAFTTGNDVFFRQGEYEPGSSEGRRLLAHELTHVVQQGGAPVQTKLTLGQPGDRFEQEADQAADAVMKAESQTAAPAVQRMENEVEEEEA